MARHDFTVAEYMEMERELVRTGFTASARPCLLPGRHSSADVGTISPAYAKTLPSYPDNASKQLPINLDWYIKYEEKASQAYQNMLTE